MKIYHPVEIGTVQKRVDVKNYGSKTQTLAVEEFLKPIEEMAFGKKNAIPSPLKLFSDMSVFRLTIYETAENTGITTSVYANIPIKQLSTITKRTANCTKYIMETELREVISTSKEQSSAAYTTELKVGNFKGKTPAHVIISDANNISLLRDTAEWLKSRFSLHPNNKIQYDAICDAIKLYESNSLQQPSVNTTKKSINIFDAPIRPQLHRERKNGKVLVTCTHIRCYPANQYPYQIEITNYYAKCEGVKPIESTISDKNKATMYLTEDQWDEIVEQMNTIKEIFIDKYGKYELDRAEREMQAKNEGMR